MPVVRGCNLPDDLLYDVDNHIWFRDLGDGTVNTQARRALGESRQILRHARVRQVGGPGEVGSRR